VKGVLAAVLVSSREAVFGARAHPRRVWIAGRSARRGTRRSCRLIVESLLFTWRVLAHNCTRSYRRTLSRAPQSWEPGDANFVDRDGKAAARERLVDRLDDPDDVEPEAGGGTWLGTEAYG
jgi:hypothetical protein